MPKAHPWALPLAGCRIVYTRSQEYFEKSALHALGATLDHVPLMDTRPKALCPDDVAFLAQVDGVLFTSAAAVRHFFTQNAWSNQTLAIAIGEPTARALRAQSIPEQALLIAPAPYDSEALLSIWQPKGKRIGIVAASGGRELLFKALGADNEVKIIECYQRYNPTEHYPTALPVPDFMMLASLQTVHHLLRITPQSYLKLLKLASTMVAISPRVAEFLKQQGFSRIISAPVAEELSQIEQIRQCWQQDRSNKQ